jgi:hypothetical protein
VSKLLLSSAAGVLLAAASPAFATAAPAAAAAQAPAAKPAAAAAPTRASVTKNIDTSFKAVDTNGDGTINQAELAAAELKGTQQRVAALRARVEKEFTKLDTNKDNQLSKAEFMAGAPQAPAAKPTGADALAQLDKNKDGKVTLDEYRAPMLARFDGMDSNHDGTLSTAERQAAEAKNKR